MTSHQLPGEMPCPPFPVPASNSEPSKFELQFSVDETNPVVTQQSLARGWECQSCCKRTTSGTRERSLDRSKKSACLLAGHNLDFNLESASSDSLFCFQLAQVWTQGIGFDASSLLCRHQVQLGWLKWTTKKFLHDTFLSLRPRPSLKS